MALVLCLAAMGLLIVVNPFGRRPLNDVAVVMDVPYVGQGVAAGTPMMMHGVKVGEVTAVSGRPNGGVQLKAALQSGPIAGLTDTLGIDYRPANYFGVTAINLIPGEGGQAVRDGMRIATVPRGNFTLQTLLYRVGQITGGVVTPQLIQVFDRATRYTDGLNPLIETMLISAEAVAKVQTVTTEQLLANATGVSVAFPALVDAATVAGDDFSTGSGFVIANQDASPALPGQDYVDAVLTPGMYLTDEYWQKRSLATLDLLAGSFFGALGKLLASHPDDLIPAVTMVKSLTDVVPALVTPENVAYDLAELRARFEKMYAGTPEQRALQVQIVLDNLPGVAAPINALGGP